jgi:hypothetical protein
MKDIPYYNGYYAAVGAPLLVAYPGYPFIRAGINNGDDLWEIAGVDETCECDIELNEEGKYLDIQNARDIHYEDDREKFPSDEVFANFRSLQGGNLAENRVYRSASPCDNQHQRAPYVDALIKEAGVKYILDLADTEEKIQGYMDKEDFNSPYFRSLYEDGKVLPLAMNMNFSSEAFQTKIVNGLTAVAENDGPFLVHCTEGKDRTGFVCMLIEALAGATYQEIVDDYMITYDNYYGITKEAEAERYDTIVTYVLLPMVQVLSGDSDPASADLAAGAEQYLLDGGMTQSQITDLRSALTGK